MSLKKLLNKIDSIKEVNQQIVLITQFYLAPTVDKNNLLKKALKNNYENKYIDNIILLNEKIYSNKELGFENEKIDKIKQININSRLQYADVFKYIQSYNVNNKIIVICNLDIYFDNSVNKLKQAKLHEFKMCYCLTRWETYKDNKLVEPFVYENFYDSSCDSWCLHTNWIHKLKS